MAYLIALASAMLYGGADFIGGLTARRTNTIAAVLISQVAGLVLLALMLPLLPAAAPTHLDLAWGGAAGLAGGTGVGLLYRALAVGTMAIVAPITAVCAVAIPVMAAMAFGERPAALALFGIGLAMVSIVLVSQPNTADTPERAATNGVSLALLSGIAIGVFFLCLARTGAAAGLWPLVSARSASVSLFAAMAFVGGSNLRMPPPVAALVIVGGAIDMLANLLYLIATRNGPLSIIVTLSSLYPASTVVLARVVLGEQLSVWQGAGIACAFVAVVLIVSGA
jgi:drug/metabolite transporter (DMT)-like permease